MNAALHGVSNLFRQELDPTYMMPLQEHTATFLFGWFFAPPHRYDERKIQFEVRAQYEAYCWNYQFYITTEDFAINSIVTRNQWLSLLDTTLDKGWVLNQEQDFELLKSQTR